MSHWDFITHNTLLKRIKHNLKEVKQKEFEVWNHRATGRTRMQLGLGKFGSRNWKATKTHIFSLLVLLERWLYCFSTTEQQPQLSRSHIYVQLPRFTSPSSSTKNLCSCFSFSSRLYENRTHFFWVTCTPLEQSNMVREKRYSANMEIPWILNIIVWRRNWRGAALSRVSKFCWAQNNRCSL